MSEEEPKIIIDEGWKARVEREKEEARKTLEKEEESAQSDTPKDGEEREITLFEHLLSGLVAQTMMALGLVAAKGQGQIPLDLASAKHLIDTLVMLRDKTKGNLIPREERSLREAIAELQRAYVARAQQAQEAALRSAEIDPKKPAQE